MTSSLKLKAKEVRIKAVKYDIVGIIITGIVTSLPVLFSSIQFADLLNMLMRNPIIAGFTLFALNLVVTNITKSISNNIEASKATRFSAASLDDVTFV